MASVTDSPKLLEHVLVSLQPSLLAVIDKARGDNERCAFIEEMLWESPVIKRAVAEYEVVRAERPKRGRPRLS